MYKVLNNTLLFKAFQILSGDLFYRIPGCKPSDQQHGGPDEQYVNDLNLNRIGVNDKGAASR